MHILQAQSGMHDQLSNKTIESESPIKDKKRYGLEKGRINSVCRCSRHSKNSKLSASTDCAVGRALLEGAICSRIETQQNKIEDTRKEIASTSTQAVSSGNSFSKHAFSTLHQSQGHVARCGRHPLPPQTFRHHPPS